MTEYRTPHPSGLSKESVYRIAEAVATEVGYAPGDDLVAVVESMGGTLEYRDFWRTGIEDTDSTHVRSKGDFTIFLSNDTSVERDNFTIAHELGHYVLHYLKPLKEGEGSDMEFRANRYGSDRTEWEANWFAAAFLMPETKFGAACAEANGKLAVVARRFGVSLSAAQIRAKALHIT